MRAPIAIWIWFLWGTIPQEDWRIPVLERESSFCEKKLFPGKPTSSGIQEERDAHVGKETVLESSHREPSGGLATGKTS